MPIPTIEIKNVLYKPDPKCNTKGILKRSENVLKALEHSNKGKDAERTGVSAATLARINIK